ncbi:MAG: hypothetical protein QOK35_2011 [Pseudonocardiales bacterium]|nr:hypothetical protein [Pseudonocardiales bacterium]
MVLVDGVGQARRCAEGSEVGEVEGAHVPPRRVRLVLERHRDDHPPARDPQHLGEHGGVGAARQVLEQVHGEHGVRRSVGERDGQGVARERRHRRAERGGDRSEQPGRSRDQVDGRHPVARGGQPQRQEAEAAAQLDHVRADRQRGGACVHGRHAGVGAARRRAAGEGREGVAVEGRPARVDVAYDRDERLLERGGVEVAGRDEVAEPAREVVAELVRGDPVAEVAAGVEPQAPSHPRSGRRTLHGRCDGRTGGAAARHRPTTSTARSVAALSSPVRSRTTRTRLQYSA